MKHTRRIYLVVLVALVAAVLPLSSLDVASAQEAAPLADSGDFSGVDSPDRAASVPPGVPTISPGAPEWGSPGEEVPSHSFTTPGVAVDERVGLVAAVGENAGRVVDGGAGVGLAPGAVLNEDGTATWTVPSGSPSTIDRGGEQVPVDVGLTRGDGVFVPYAAPHGVEIAQVATGDGAGGAAVGSLEVGGDRVALGVGDAAADDVAGVLAGDSRSVEFSDVSAAGGDLTVEATRSGVKTTWTVDTPEELAGVVETLAIPAGWTAVQVGTAVEIRDETGARQALWVGGPVWDAKIAADYGFDANGELNELTPEARAAIERRGDVDEVLADEAPVSALIAPAAVELVGLTDGVVSVRLVVPDEWLSDPGRVWPVSVDPTLDPNPSDGYYVYTSFPNASSYWETNDGFWTGTGGFGVDYMSYVAFDLSAIEGTEVPVNSATLRLYQDYAATCSPKLLTVSRVTESWDSSITWNNQPTITSTNDVDQSDSKGRFLCSAGWIEIDITDIVQDWVDGDANYGLQLDGHSSFKKFEDNPEPELVVNYDTANLDASYTLDTTPAGWFSEPDSDTYTGSPDEAQPGRLPVSVTNDGNIPWTSANQRCLGYHLYATDTATTPITGTSGIAKCPSSSNPISPSETWDIDDAQITVPDLTEGVYYLRWDMAEPDGTGGWTYFSEGSTPVSSPQEFAVQTGPDADPGSYAMFALGAPVELAATVQYDPGDDVRFALEAVSNFGDGDCESGTATTSQGTSDTWSVPGASVNTAGWYMWCVAAEDSPLADVAEWSPWAQAWFRVIDPADPPANGAQFGDDPANRYQVGVNLGMGSYQTSRTDLSIPTITGGLTLTRFLETGSDMVTGFGPSWSHSYAMRIVEDTGTDDVYVVYPDGRWELHAHVNTEFDGDRNYDPPAGKTAQLRYNNGPDVYELTFLSGVEWIFDDDGKITTITEPDGNDIDITYDVSDQIDAVTDAASGREIRFTWSIGRITEVEVDHPDGVSSPLVWRYAYTDGFLTAACDPRDNDLPFVMGTSTCEWFNWVDGELVTIANVDGDTTHTIGYDTQGRVDTLTQHPDGATSNTTTFAYAGSFTVTVTDANSNDWIYDFNTARRITSERAPGVSAGNATTYTYDGTSGMLTLIEDALESIGYDYDSSRRIQEIIDPAGNSSWLARDGDGNVTHDCDARTDATLSAILNGSSDDYCIFQDWDGDRNMTERSYPAPVPGDSDHLVSETWTYTDGTGTPPEGLVASHTSTTGVTTTFDYNAAGDLIEEENQATGLRTVYTHDDWGRVLTVTEYADAHPSGIVVSTYTYTELGAIATETGPSVTNTVSSTAHQQRTTTYYDTNGDIEQVDVADLVGGDSIRSTEYTRDRLGRVTVVEDPYDDATTFEYDAVGNQAEVCDPLGVCTRYDYDAKNQLVEIILVDTFDNETTLNEYGYDDIGQVEWEIDAEGRRVDYTRDEFGRVTRAEIDWTWTTAHANSKLYIIDRDFDEVGNITEERLGGGYDGATSSAVDPAWVTHTSWDRANRPTRIYEDDDTTPTSNAERETDNDYNTDGLLDRVQIERSSNVLFETRYDYGTSGNTTGLLISEIVENGTDDLETTYDYDDRGLIVETVPPRGNAAGATPANYATATTYDVLRRPVTVTGPSVTIDTGTSTSTGQPTVTYGYNTFGDRTHVTDPNSNTTVTDFDDLGRVDVVTYPTYSPPDAGSNITPTEDFDYDAVGRVTEYTNRRGKSTNYDYDEFGHMVTETDHDLEDTDFVYDLLGNVTSVTDPTGAVTTYTYDDLYRRTRTTQNVRAVSVSLPGGGSHDLPSDTVLTDYTYDSLGRQTAVSVPYSSGGTPEWTTTTYDSLGYVNVVTDPDGRATDYDYDRLGRLTSVEDPLDRATEYDYDQAGRQIAIRRVDADGDTAAETSFAYDAGGNVTTVTDPLGNDTDFTYDVLGRLTAVDEPLTSGTATTTYGYDAAGNMTRMVDANSNTTVYSYNVWNLPETTIEPATTAHPNAADRTFTTVYDGGGLPTKQIMPGTVAVTVTNTYDNLGRLTNQTSPTGGSRTFTYDENGRVLTASHPGTGDQEFHYDDRGLLVAALGPAGDSLYDYDAAARLTERDDTAGTHTYTWTSGGLLDTLTDPLTGLDAEWTYNSAGQATAITYDNGSTDFDRTFGYDAVGRLVEDTQTDTSDNVEARTRMGFDPRGDLVYEALDLPANGAAGGVSNYGYDPSDRLTEWARLDSPDITVVVGDSGSPNSDDNDLKDRLEDTFSATVTFRSDELAAPTSGADAIVVSPSVVSSTLDSSYDTVALPVVNLENAAWDEMSLVTTASTTTSTDSLDVADQIHPLAASLVGEETIATTNKSFAVIDDDNLGTGADIAAVAYGTDDAIAFTYDTGATLADSSTAPARRAGLGYTSGAISNDLTTTAWRLFDNTVAWALADPDTAEVTTYAYDPVGNRTSVTLPDTTVDTFTYDERNRILTDPNGDYTWTQRGTLAEFDDGVDTTTYSYNGLGELATVTTTSGSVTYAYDGLGRLGQRNGTSAEFDYAGFDPDPVYDGDSTYTRMPTGTLFAVDDGTDANLAVLNRHGDLQHLTDPANGNPAATQITDPWGIPITSTGTNPDIGYQGDYTDPDTGLVNMGARWYDPDTGTFTSRDTYGGEGASPKTTNRYLYGNANPNKHWDPTGYSAAQTGCFYDAALGFEQCPNPSYNATLEADLITLAWSCFDNARVLQCKELCHHYGRQDACQNYYTLNLDSCVRGGGEQCAEWAETQTRKPLPDELRTGTTGSGNARTPNNWKPAPWDGTNPWPTTTYNGDLNQACSAGDDFACQAAKDLANGAISETVAEHLATCGQGKVGNWAIEKAAATTASGGPVYHCVAVTGETEPQDQQTTVGTFLGQAAGLFARSLSGSTTVSSSGQGGSAVPTFVSAIANSLGGALYEYGELIDPARAGDWAAVDDGAIVIRSGGTAVVVDDVLSPAVQGQLRYAGDVVHATAAGAQIVGIAVEGYVIAVELAEGDLAGARDAAGESLVTGALAWAGIQLLSKGSCLSAPAWCGAVTITSAAVGDDVYDAIPDALNPGKRDFWDPTCFNGC